MSCCSTSMIASDVANARVKSGQDMHQPHALLAATHSIGDGLVQTDFVVPSMHCGGCIASIERTICKLEYVEKVRANLSLKRVSVVWREETGNLREIDLTLSDLGFEHSPFDSLADNSNSQKEAGRNLLTALGVAGFGAANIMLLSVSVWSGADPQTAKLFHLLSGIIAVPVVAHSGQPFFRSAFGALKARRLNMDVPISLAVLLALGISIFESLFGGAQAYFDAAVTLLFFLLIGRYLDYLMRDKARDAVVALNNISPKGATIIGEDGSQQYAAINEILPGQILRIFAGERIPVDGEIIKGDSDLDRSLVTGENLPVTSHIGNIVEAGTLNITGVIDIRALRDAKHSFLAEVSKMMTAAEKGRGHFTRIADQMARIYAPAVHLLAALAFVGWMIATKGDWHTSIYIAISVLIITCPCALGLAVPVAHVIAARRLLKQGIIIIDGAGFERMEKVTRIIFDKTGTLTTGTPKIIAADKMAPLQKMIAASLGARSNHPASHAVHEFLQDQSEVELSDIRELPGFGMRASYQGKEVRLGQTDWVGKIAATQKPGTSASVGFCIENGKQVSFQLSEELRADAIDAVQRLDAMGLNMEIQSGDSKSPVREIARKIGITKFWFGQKPMDKIARIEDLQNRGDKVLMIGDGLNDAPALAGAHASIAPSKSSDVGRQAANFVFTNDSLMCVPFALNISRQAGAIVRQNFALAIMYNIVAVPFAVAGYVTPLVAAIAMSASSIVVIGNSMRLSRESELHE